MFHICECVSYRVRGAARKRGNVSCLAVYKVYGLPGTVLNLWGARIEGAVFIIKNCPSFVICVATRKRTEKRHLTSD